MTQLRSVTCHMESHSVTCYPTQVNTPLLKPGTRFTYPGGMEGWVDLVDLIAPRPQVEPATFWSRVRRRTTALLSTKTTVICDRYFVALMRLLMLVDSCQTTRRSTRDSRCLWASTTSQSVAQQWTLFSSRMPWFTS